MKKTLIWLIAGIFAGLLILGILAYFLFPPIVVVPPEKIAVVIPVVDITPKVPEVVFAGIISVSPLSASKQQSLTNDIIVTFDEPMDSLSINDRTFMVKDSKGTAVSGAITSDSTLKIWTFNPTSSLSSDFAYTVTITTGAKGVSGNSLIKNFVWSFSTITRPSSGGSSSSGEPAVTPPVVPPALVIPSLNVCSSGCNSTTLQDAITLANSGDIIGIESGIYLTTGQIIINKNLSIIGIGETKPIIRPSTNFSTTTSVASAWLLINENITFNLQNVILDGNGKIVTQAIRNHGNTTIDGVDFINIRGSKYAGLAVSSYGGIVAGGAGSDSNGGAGKGQSLLEVRNSNFMNIQRIGVLVKGTNSIAIITRNTFIGKGAGDFLDYGIEVGAGGSITASNNFFSNNLGVATDGSTSACILATTYFGSGTQATIINNTIMNSSYGITVGYDSLDSSLVVAHLNKFIGNTFGIESTNPVVNASTNWWGDATGPSHPINNPSGLGDKIIGNVTFSNFCINPACS